MVHNVTTFLTSLSSRGVAGGEWTVRTYLSLSGSVPSSLSGGQPIFPLITALHSSHRFRKSRPRFQLWARREGPVCNGRGVCHGPRPTPHAPGALLRISRPLPAHGQHWWQRAAQPHPRCQFQRWVLAYCVDFAFAVWFRFILYSSKIPSVRAVMHCFLTHALTFTVYSHRPHSHCRS